MSGEAEQNDSAVAELADLLRDTEAHHGPYEATAPKHHWSGWYAAYILARQNGKTKEQASEDAGLYMERELAGGDTPA
jgi:hypothetical protein